MMKWLWIYDHRIRNVICFSSGRFIRGHVIGVSGNFRVSISRLLGSRRCDLTLLPFADLASVEEMLTHLCQSLFGGETYEKEISDGRLNRVDEGIIVRFPECVDGIYASEVLKNGFLSFDLGKDIKRSIEISGRSWKGNRRQLGLRHEGVDLVNQLHGHKIKTDDRDKTASALKNVNVDDDDDFETIDKRVLIPLRHEVEYLKNYQIVNFKIYDNVVNELSRKAGSTLVSKLLKDFK